MPDSIRPERCERCGSPSCCDHWRGQADKARAEVERLRADQQTYADTYARNMERLRAEVERLREALQEIVDHDGEPGFDALRVAAQAIGDHYERRNA
jgi:hypothetical protein